MVVISGDEGTLTQLGNRAEEKALKIRQLREELRQRIEELTASGSGGLTGKTGAALALVDEMIAGDFARNLQTLENLAASVRRTGSDLARSDEDSGLALQSAAESAGSAPPAASAARPIEAAMGGG